MAAEAEESTERLQKIQKIQSMKQISGSVDSHLRMELRQMVPVKKTRTQMKNEQAVADE